jgi:arabinofuranosyltransferase
VQDDLVLRDATPKRTTLLPLLAGISGYLAGPDVIVQESYGLGDAVISRLPPFEHTNPAHRKGPVGDWVYALRLKPDVVVPNTDNDRIAAARRALRCGALADLHDTISASLDLDRFLSNLTGAVDTTTLTIPRNPYRAEKKFCGPKARGRPTTTTAIPTTAVPPTSTTSSR